MCRARISGKIVSLLCICTMGSLREKHESFRKLNKKLLFLNVHKLIELINKSLLSDVVKCCKTTYESLRRTT